LVAAMLRCELLKPKNRALKKMEKTAKSEPWIQVVESRLTRPSLKDNTADVDRLLKGMEKALQGNKVAIGFSLLKKIPTLLREYDYSIRAVLYQDDHCWHLIDVFPLHSDLRCYALAVDMGSSTVVVQLIDLIRKAVQEEISFINPQNDIGPDILTRIHFASQEGGLDRLQTLLVDKLNQEIRKLGEKHAIQADTIVAVSAAGNTAMTHLFLGLDPYWICREPYIPVVNKPALLRSAELGLAVHPEAPVLTFPNVGSYFGGDLVAGILASGMAEAEDLSILVDVGTNAEVVIGNREWLVACAGAAGPALEGGVASMGMMAGPGVIDKVRIDPVSKAFSVRTIQEKPPVGICGSGLIDLVAQLYLAGMIDLRGKFVADRCQERLEEVDGIKHLIVVRGEDSGTGRDLTLSQPDIDALVRSKAAMYTILTTITSMLNVSMKEISCFYIAGTFGSYIDPQSAITLGMIPDLPLEKYRPLGNTSLTGARVALLSARARDEIYGIRDRITYLELNVNQEFMNLFSAAKFIPHTDKSLFPSVPSH
jgi:uncharacterized 2Fe-2S/4Fe-4S cluster protein (DUF4445 family)